MSATKKAFGLGSELEFEGVTYVMDPLNLVQISMIESWIEEQQWKAHRRSRTVLPDDEYETNAARLRSEIGEHKYAYPNPAFLKTLFSLPGIKYTTFISLKDKYLVTEELVDKMIQAKYQEILDNIIKDNGSSDEDPPAQGEKASLPSQT